MLVEKEVIGPGTYWYTDQETNLPRKLVVTPELTRYWHDQGNKMLAVGLTVPVPCEHDFDAHPMTPADKLKSNAGWVKEYRMGTPKKDGTRADDSRLFSVVDIQDEELAKKLPKTIRYTSPWFNTFTDGDGREWKNVVSHLALTTRPRVTAQQPFPSIAAALSIATDAKLDDATGGKGFCLSRMGKLVERDKRLVPRYPVAFSLYSGGVALAEDDMPPPKKKAPKEGVTPGELPAEDDLDEGNGEADLNTMGEDKGLGDPKGDVSMEELLCDLLGALGIHCERNGGEAEFKRALYNAAMTKIHELTNGGQGQDNKPANQTSPAQQQPNPLIHQEQQPMYMSLDDINKIDNPVMKSMALSMYNENVKLRGELDATAKITNSLRDVKLKEENAKRASRVAMLSRLSPRVKADLDAMVALPAMALSMGDGGAVVDPMAQVLTVLEKGLADMPKLLTTSADQILAMPQPTDADALSAERIDELSNMLIRDTTPKQKAS
jgi:hypothetical protein